MNSNEGVNCFKKIFNIKNTNGASTVTLFNIKNTNGASTDYLPEVELC